MEVLDFWLKNGGKYQGILLAARNSRRGLPPRFAEIEEMTEHWMPFYITAFYELMTERPIGFGVAPIPWSKIKAYAAHHGMGYLAGEMFHDIIRAMDKHWMDEQDKKSGKP